eukprot:CAMPEP_0176207334 /NCGR_PEP_ID=MMETSP0121_2-20121125/12561_1 /TAXON_ID=160619 /ORGANISM="Kryptoperidinium foliaceum, Strain CCMP 1326" /LENGTH=142 /DNA_ID=CAMNT_0017546305 /DNA_START=110 /DNA_END=538 /DNA_ORIENTATION=-
MGNSACCCAKDLEHEQREACPLDPPGIGTGKGADAGDTRPPPAVVAAEAAERFVHVLVDRAAGDRLGVDVDHKDGVTLEIHGVTGGLIAAWNRDNPESLVEKGDRIVEVNGASGRVERLVHECRKEQVLKLVVRKGPMEPSP